MNADGLQSRGGPGGSLDMNYAYPVCSNYSTKLQGTAKFYAFAGISQDNPDEGITLQGGQHDCGGDSHYWYENTFDSLGQTLEYRKWTYVSSGGLSPTGVTNGSKVGDIKAIDQPPASILKEPHGGFTVTCGPTFDDGTKYGYIDYDFCDDKGKAKIGPFKYQQQHHKIGYCVINQITVIDWNID